MIPVKLAEEPESFDREVRQPGLAWLKKRSLDPEKKVPPKTTLKPFWRQCLPELHRRYRGVCAYFCVYLEPELGGISTDHYLAKAQHQAKLAYEWSNFRLACDRMNTLKGTDLSDVLDPFEIEPATFFLELITGRVFPNPQLDANTLARAQITLGRLKLDEPGAREMRRRRFFDYLQLRGQQRNPDLEGKLRQYSPFIWFEAKRQDLL